MQVVSESSVSAAIAAEGTWGCPEASPQDRLKALLTLLLHFEE